ncbi:MAG: cupin domain-containing protein [Clostridia bacterium]|jgi:mannose-6-phosphate isomerase-like protein (cupin superfamily)|nr:cupin domain-containing protein [Clostridia bacterium]MDD3231895.1 cupin domain-containing protein [Clostridia bacterium]MDD3862907.1 cupin domain-containing protein [Clostridia bacterium]
MIFKNQSEKTYIDYGPEPFVVNIERATIQNNNFRTTLWTGEHLQLTLMHIPVGGEIGLERHATVDQFLSLESGNGLIIMGQSPEMLNYQANVSKGYAIFVPAGTYHNLVNKGNIPIKLYSIYAPPEHPHGTVHRTKEESDAEHY